MRSRVFLKLLAAFLLVIAAATLTLDFAVRRAWTRSLRQEIERGLLGETRLLAQRMEADHMPAAVLVEQHAAATESRATIIDRSGRVLADSEADPATMENHADRPEMQRALRGETGIATRRSETVGIDFLYVAVPYRDGAVRLAYPLSSVEQSTTQVRGTLLTGSLLALLVALALAAYASHLVSRRLRRIVQFAEAVAAGDLSARVADNAGDEIAQVAAALDTTAQHLEESFAALEHSRRELETLLNSMHDGVVAVDSAGRVQWANGSLQRLLPQGVRVGASAVESVRDPDLLRALQEAAADREPRRVRASVVPGRTFEVTATPLPGGGAVAVMHDLTDVERVEKTRRDFIANVSHELRTPLTSIQGYAETLAEAPPEEAAREFLEIIRKNAARMTRLTEDLLTLARVESGEQKLEREPVAVLELLQDALNSFREEARTRGMELLDEDAPAAQVLADRDAIHQVFSNLIDNALKYAPSGTRIVLGARETEGSVEMYVRDFGPGIASEHLPRLFERFYRVDKARSREAGGTGLGLAIVKHIVLQHGGSVRAESELGRGSTFFFTLPARSAEAAAR